MRSTAVVNSVIYRRGSVQLQHVRRSAGNNRCAAFGFRAREASRPMASRSKQLDELSGNGFRVTKLGNGDALVTIRHDSAKNIVVEGDDPQQQTDDAELTFTGKWDATKDQADWAGGCRVSDAADAAVTMRLRRQPGPIDRTRRSRWRIGRRLSRRPETAGRHRLLVPGGAARTSALLPQRIAGRSPYVARRRARERTTQNRAAPRVYVDALQWSAATGTSGYGAGGGPTETQCMLMGFPGREDMRDSRGNMWRPGTEFIIRTGTMTDSVAQSWWTTPAPLPVLATE